MTRRQTWPCAHSDVSALVSERKKVLVRTFRLPC